MSFKLGNTSINQLYLGSTDIKKAYLGSTLIYDKTGGNPPVNTVVPVASGIGYTGQTLTTTNGTWTGDPTITFTYQWKSNGTSISGATSNTYIVTSTTEGSSLTCEVTGTNGFGNSSATSNAIHNWIPTDLASSPVGWFDGNDATTITLNGSTVSSWDNRGTAGGSVTQGTAANQPTYQETGWTGGLPTISFDGLNDSLFWNTTALSWGQSQSGAFFIVYDGGTIADTTTVILESSVGGGSTNKDLMIFSEGPAATKGTYFGTGSVADSGAWLLEQGRLLSTTPELLSGELISTGAATGNKNLYSNGELIANSSYALKAVSGNRFTVGAQGNGSSGTINAFYPGLISEVIILKYAPSLEERQKIEGYLAWKWGLEGNLPSGHPYKTNPPTV